MVEGGFSVGEIERVANDFFNGNKIIFNIITRKKIVDIVLFLNIGNFYNNVFSYLYCFCLVSKISETAGNLTNFTYIISLYGLNQSLGTVSNTS